MQNAMKLYKHGLFDNLYEDLTKARTAIIANTPLNQRRHIVNALGITSPLSLAKGRKRKGEMDKRKALAHLLQGVEAKILKETYMFCGSDIILPLHDGFISEQPLILTDLQDHITKTTGFSLAYDQKQLSIPSEVQELGVTG